MSDACELCDGAGGPILWQDELCRVVAIEEAGYPGFCRVILNRHVAEMTDLPRDERRQLMEVVFATEVALREILRPDKMNLASFGNMTPHVHWHLIPRWCDDPHFPQPFWGAAQRPATSMRPSPDRQMLQAAIAQALACQRSEAS